MSYFKDFLLQELKLVIVSYIQPNKINISELDSCVATIQNLKTYDDSLINVPHLDKLIRIKELYKKYAAYNSEYESDPDDSWYWKCLIYEPPQLLDALFAGCRLYCAKSSVESYDETVEKDIYNIVNLIPSVINCNLGVLLCRDLITPLYAACLNENIPIHIIKFLHDNGADIKQKIRVNGHNVDILADLNDYIIPSRYIAIKKIFSEKEIIQQ
jgi:hypothetical protein